MPPKRKYKSKKRSVKRRRVASARSYKKPSTSYKMRSSTYNRKSRKGRSRTPYRRRPNRIMSMNNLARNSNIFQESALKHTISVGNQYRAVCTTEARALFDNVTLTSILDALSTGYDKLIIREGRQVTRMTNNDRQPVKITMYWFRPRENLDLSNSTTNMTITTYITNLFTYGASPTYDQSHLLGWKLFDAPAFCQRFKILKVQKRRVMPGMDTTFTWTSKKPWIWQKRKNDSAFTHGSKRTIYCMFTAEVPLAETDGGVVTTTTADILTQTSFMYSHAYAIDATPNHTYANNLATSLAGGAVNIFTDVDVKVDD